MLSNQDPSHLKRVKKVAYKLNLPEEVIELALYYTSEYIKKKASKPEINPHRLLTKEEFEKLMPIFLVPDIGYLKPNYWKYKALHFKGKQKLERELLKEIKPKEE